MSGQLIPRARHRAPAASPSRSVAAGSEVSRARPSARDAASGWATIPVSSVTISSRPAAVAGGQHRLAGAERLHGHITQGILVVGQAGAGQGPVDPGGDLFARMEAETQFDAGFQGVPGHQIRRDWA